MLEQLKTWVRLSLRGLRTNRQRSAIVGGLLGITVVIYALAFVVLPPIEDRSRLASPTPDLVPTLPPTETPTPTPTLTPTPTSTPTLTPTPSPTPTPSMVNHFSRKPIALMVENHPDARPQSGLGLADVVYETVTEAHITRFLAIFANHDAEVVGPIRSTRHYFVALAAEYDAVLGIAGASPQGFSAVRRTGVLTVDNNRGEGRYYRTADREAPHNLYTSTDGVRSVVDDEGVASLSAIEFKSDQPAPADVAVTAIRVTYPDGYYVQYRYEPMTNDYVRLMLGQPHVDAATGKQLRAKNVVVQFAETWPIAGDDAGRVDVELVGTGAATLFLDGKVIEGTWEKLSETDKTVFFDADGEPIRFNVGPTWIQIVHTTGSVRYE